MGKIETSDQAHILALATSGHTLREISREIGCDVHTLYVYRQTNPEFSEQLEKALIAGAYAWLDEVRETLFTNLSEGANPLIARVKLEAARFYLEKRFRREFAPETKISVQHAIDLRPALESARLRLANYGQVIDLTPNSSGVSTNRQLVADADFETVHDHPARASGK